MALNKEGPGIKHGSWKTFNGLILALAMITSAIAWWMIAWPVLIFANVANHPGHFMLTFAHMFGGTGMMVLGGLNLYLAFSGKLHLLHRWAGRLYLAFGTFGSLSAIVVTLSPAHKSAGTVFTSSTISLLMLACAWLAFAAMGWRAANNRRFPSHSQWMIRSYVLVWSFVFCRIASRVSDIDELGGGEAFIWLSWVLPLILAEIALQWPKGSQKRGSPQSIT